MQLFVDRKEHGLIAALNARGLSPEVRSLPCGDVMGTCSDGARGFLFERKRADDFAASIRDGRYREQASRMFETGHRVIYVIEGDLRELGLYEELLSAVVAMNMRASSAFRTVSTDETARLVLILARKLQSYPAPVVSGGLQAPRSKQQKASDCVFMRMLMCVPSISESIAGKLVEHFGDLETLQGALRAGAFPRIQLNEKRAIGKARVAALSRCLLRADPA